MRKLLLTLVLLSSSVMARAQDSTVTANVYFSVGAATWNRFALNDVIRANGGTPFRLFTPELGMGVLISSPHFQTYLDIRGMFSKKKSDNFPYRFSYALVQAGFRYKILRIQEQRLYAGLNIAYMEAGADLYPVNSSIDFWHIDPDVQQGVVHLYSRNLLLGPTLSTGDLFPNSNFNMEVSAAYNFNVLGGRWQSKHIQTLHAPVEEGSRVSLSVIFPIND